MSYTDLRKPDIVATIMIREKSHESTVGRDHRFGGLKISQPGKASLFEQVGRPSSSSKGFPPKRLSHHLSLFEAPQVHEHLAHGLITVTRVFLERLFDDHAQHRRHIVAERLG